MATVSHPVFARVYERLSVAMDRAGTAAFRRELVAGLSGRVIEIGAGNGRMFAHYPPEVTQVLAVEPERRLRASAERAASDAPVPVTVVDGLAQALPAGDGEFDAAVVALVLCTVPDQASALAEISRVLRPGGQVRFFEHVAAEEASGLRRAQRIVEATLWPKLFAGCHTDRDTVAAIAAAGFEVAGAAQVPFPGHQQQPLLPLRPRPGGQTGPGSPLSQASRSAGERSNTTGGAAGSACQARIRRRARANAVTCHTRIESRDSTLLSDSRLPLQITSPVSTRRTVRRSNHPNERHRG